MSLRSVPRFHAGWGARSGWPRSLWRPERPEPPATGCTPLTAPAITDALHALLVKRADDLEGCPESTRAGGNRRCNRGIRSRPLAYRQDRRRQRLGAPMPSGHFLLMIQIETIIAARAKMPRNSEGCVICFQNRKRDWMRTYAFVQAAQNLGGSASRTYHAVNSPG